MLSLPLSRLPATDVGENTLKVNVKKRTSSVHTAQQDRTSTITLPSMHNMLSGELQTLQGQMAKTPGAVGELEKGEGAEEVVLVDHQSRNRNLTTLQTRYPPSRTS